MKTALLLCTIFTISSAHAQVLEGLKPINGTQLYFHTIGTGEPLVVVHGGPGLNHQYFLPHLDKLSKKYKILFYDQRASGQSATPSPDSISLKFFADDIEAIRKELGVEKLNLLGHSWGVVPLIQYAKMYPGKVNKMILCNPVPLSREFDAQVLENQKKKASGKDSTDRSIIVGSRGFGNGEPDAYRKLMLLSFRNSFYDRANIAKLRIELPSNFVKASQALMTGLGKEMDFNYYEDIKSFAFPVLIQFGTADVVPLAAVTLMQSNLQKASLEMFKKSGHFVFVEESGKFTRSVDGFLGKK